jgi:hypothetical protein
MDEPAPASGADDPEPEHHWDPEDRRLGAGLALDAVLHSSPAFLLVGLTVGIVVAVAMAVTTIRKYL